jgi:hypothetical protein
MEFKKKNQICKLYFFTCLLQNLSLNYHIPLQGAKLRFGWKTDKQRICKFYYKLALPKCYQHFSPRRVHIHPNYPSHY